MFKDFENTKKQLSELAETINKFKSEAVQLRLLELLFDAKSHEIEALKADKSPPIQRKPKKRKSVTNTADSLDSTKPKKKAASAAGPVSVLRKLYDEGGFL